MKDKKITKEIKERRSELNLGKRVTGLGKVMLAIVCCAPAPLSAIGGIYMAVSSNVKLNRETDNFINSATYQHAIEQRDERIEQIDSLIATAAPSEQNSLQAEKDYLTNYGNGDREILNYLFADKNGYIKDVALQSGYKFNDYARGINHGIALSFGGTLIGLAVSRVIGQKIENSDKLDYDGLGDMALDGFYEVCTGKTLDEREALRTKHINIEKEA